MDVLFFVGVAQSASDSLPLTLALDAAIIIIFFFFLKTATPILAIPTTKLTDQVFQGGIANEILVGVVTRGGIGFGRGWG